LPELPEVEVVRRGLESHVKGRRISRVDVFHDRAVRRHAGGRSDFEQILANRDVLGVRRRGKYLWWVLDGGDALIAHLGMSGQFRIGGPPSDSSARIDHPHLRIRFRFVDGGPDLDFLDQRTFGGMAFDAGGAELPAPLAHIARDPLDPAFDLDSVVKVLRRKDTELKRSLLDQSLISGIGNIYADEALWASRQHYARPTLNMPAAAARAVIGAATAVMTEALAQGGTSFDSLYVNVNGESGYFSRSLHAYGREGEPCDRCGTPIRRDAFMNRSSYFCPRCQRLPRARHD
jgi:formamidopyrimidine-DNA glycosylase